MVHINRKLNTVPSTELGFTGDSTQWFDEEAYRFPKSKASFDEAGKHDYYFNSYSSHHIHEEMLKDTSRTLAYQRAIEGNPEDFKDKVGKMIKDLYPTGFFTENACTEAR